MLAPRPTHHAVAALFAAAIVATIPVQRAAAETETNGFLIINPWLDDTTSGNPLDPPDGVGWTFNSPWEFEDSLISFVGAALFPTTSSNPIGVHAAEASAVDLTVQPNVTALDGYDASTTRLTGLTFELPWRVGHFGTVPQSGEYEMFMEFTIDTPSGSYRASTNRLDRATAFQNTIVQLPFVFEWETEGFLGDPFAGGGGVPLDQITNVDYQILVDVISPTTGGAGFFNAEGFNIQYEVSSAVSPSLPGDYNGDGAVDAADYTVWRDNEGATEDGAILSGNGDGGTVGESDYQLWVSRYGDSSTSFSAAAAVPEPSSLLCLGGAMVAMWIGSRADRFPC